jgi:peptidoglycan-associated lipoprotein
MRSKFFSHAIILALIATLGLTGCKNGRWFWQKPRSGAQSGAEPAPLTPSEGIAGGPRPLITGEMQHGQFAAVYFDYDSAKIRPSEVSKLEAVAAALKGNSKNLVVEGHTDERGTAEYNRALGERRAQSAREELVRLGVDANRLTTISYGKDRPVEPSHDETAWSKNRRCEFVIVSQ